MELNSGVGGTEAALFTGDLYTMYENFCNNRGFVLNQLELDKTPTGGVRFALLTVEGPLAYSALRFESGVHRVQRVPVTDTTRMHTSTASVSVLPIPEEKSISFPPGTIKMETMRASGPGGQNVNKRESAVRLTHLPTGISVHSMEERFQYSNIKIAYGKLSAILLQKELEESENNFTNARRLHVGSKARAEKIRTYNFKDDRITDHRLRLSVFGMSDFLSAGNGLERFVAELENLNRLEKLREILSAV